MSFEKNLDVALSLDRLLGITEQATRSQIASRTFEGLATSFLGDGGIATPDLNDFVYEACREDERTFFVRHRGRHR